MANFNLSPTFNNIIGGLKTLGASLGIFPQSDTATYPNAGEAFLPKVKPENWAHLPLPYTFSVIDIDSGKNTGGFSDFALPLAPNSITQTEEFAISIKPTQYCSQIKTVGYINIGCRIFVVVDVVSQ